MWNRLAVSPWTFLWLYQTVIFVHYSWMMML